MAGKESSEGGTPRENLPQETKRQRAEELLSELAKLQTDGRLPIRGSFVFEKQVPEVVENEERERRLRESVSAEMEPAEQAFFVQALTLLNNGECTQDKKRGIRRDRESVTWTGTWNDTASSYPEFYGSSDLVKITSTNTLQFTDKEGIIRPSHYTRTYESPTKAPAVLDISFTPDGEIEELSLEWEPEDGVDLVPYLNRTENGLRRFTNIDNMAGGNLADKKRKITITPKALQMCTAYSATLNDYIPFGKNRYATSIFTYDTDDGNLVRTNEESKYTKRISPEDENKRRLFHADQPEIVRVTPTEFIALCHSAVSLLPIREES